MTNDGDHKALGVVKLYLTFFLKVCLHMYINTHTKDMWAITNTTNQM